MSPTGRCSDTARTGCSVANATDPRYAGAPTVPVDAGPPAGESWHRTSRLRVRPRPPPGGRPRPLEPRLLGLRHTVRRSASVGELPPANVGRFTSRYSSRTAGSSRSQSRNSNAHRHPRRSLTLRWRLTRRPGSALPWNRLFQPAGSDRPGGCWVSASIPTSRGNPASFRAGVQPVGRSPGRAPPAGGRSRPWPAARRSRSIRCGRPASPPAAAEIRAASSRASAGHARVGLDQHRTGPAGRPPTGQPVVGERQQPLQPQRPDHRLKVGRDRRRCRARRRTASDVPVVVDLRGDPGPGVRRPPSPGRPAGPPAVRRAPDADDQVERRGDRRGHAGSGCR